MKVVIVFYYNQVRISKLISEHPKTYHVAAIDKLPWQMQTYTSRVSKKSNVIVADFCEDILKKVKEIEKLNNKEFKEQELLDKKYEALRKIYFDQIKTYGD